jgi:fructose-1,6-bisphosphatase/inositol monophosphatase family enzyme
MKGGSMSPSETMTEYRPILNGHASGIILKELVRRAIMVIRNERYAFAVQAKRGYGGGMDDVFTSADTKAQRIYLRSLQECFPDYGIVAEEDSLSIPCKNGCGAYFTVDPLDGTKAFVRRQSHGVGTMIALVEGGKVVSAYVGDVSTKEIYGFRPGSSRVHRISEFDTSEDLGEHVGIKGQLGGGYVALRDREEAYSSLSRLTIGRRFKNVIVDGGSIGTWMARLWKGEIDAALIPRSWETPWDSSPVIGISLALGLVFLRPDADGDGWARYDPILSPEKYRREHDTLVIHEDYVNLL